MLIDPIFAFMCTSCLSAAGVTYVIHMAERERRGGRDPNHARARLARDRHSAKR